LWKPLYHGIGGTALQQYHYQLTGLNLHRSYLNLDSCFDSKANRKAIFNARLIPNIPENPRNRKRTKRGCKRLFDAAILYVTGASGADVRVGGQIQAVVAAV